MSRRSVALSDAMRKQLTVAHALARRGARSL
jgi:hypothetical protein